ncbi:response regulator transcription factor [Mediterraneibacter glycyrrhizinilyticus]
MYRILIVEDDRGIAESIREQANMWGFTAKCAAKFSNIMEEFAAFDPQLVLLDISLPFYNGYHWCAEIRKVSKVPVIFISSASDNMNIVMAMNMGADDFIAKPFDLNVLIAKIQALLRRTYDFGNTVPVLEHRGAILNTGDNTLTYREEKISLTKNEYRILLALMENKGKVVSRERLMERLWETDCFVDDNTLTVNINRLRKKLDGAGLEDFIVTKFGRGYRAVWILAFEFSNRFSNQNLTRMVRKNRIWVEYFEGRRSDEFSRKRNRGIEIYCSG